MAEPEKYRFPKERRKLIRLASRDQKARAHDELYYQRPEASLEMAHVDLANQRQLKKILETVKSPSVRNIGADGAQAVWLIAQHAGYDLALMKRVLKLMQAIARWKPAETYYRGIPYLIDAANYMQGKKQRYGTQFWRGPDGHIEAYPIEDKGHLDERRCHFGLRPFKEYERNITGKQH